LAIKINNLFGNASRLETFNKTRPLQHFLLFFAKMVRDNVPSNYWIKISCQLLDAYFALVNWTKARSYWVPAILYFALHWWCCMCTTLLFFFQFFFQFWSNLDSRLLTFFSFSFTMNLVSSTHETHISNYWIFF
jgi:hypothetical protein